MRLRDKRFIFLQIRNRPGAEFLNRGFALLEVLVATGILVIVLSGVLVTFVSCILMNEANSNLVIASNDAQSILEHIKQIAASDYDTIDDYIAAFDEEQFTNLKDESITFPGSGVGLDIATININVSWRERGELRSYQLSTQIAYSHE
jgi:prepilin-type N-terminal cleavage/methylation domain-containing protein